MPVTVRVCDAEQDVDAVLDAVRTGLTAHNDRFLPKERGATPITLSARDAAGEVVGGLVGEIELDWLYIDRLWVDERARGGGAGRLLVALAEDEARRRGLSHVHLWTWSFQAPEFYRSLGYEEFGRLDNHPRGHAVHMFVKRL
jgi:GNAT superfamily N-acetyltransferase